MRRMPTVPNSASVRRSTASMKNTWSRPYAASVCAMWREPVILTLCCGSAAAVVLILIEISQTNVCKPERVDGDQVTSGARGPSFETAPSGPPQDEVLLVAALKETCGQSLRPHPEEPAQRASRRMGHGLKQLRSL